MICAEFIGIRANDQPPLKVSPTNTSLCVIWRTQVQSFEIDEGSEEEEERSPETMEASPLILGKVSLVI